jgi:3-mercaptopyruvate sulfurtransferase SseA
LKNLDVRTHGDHTGSAVKIQDAVREDPADVSSWANKYSKDATIVLYCAWAEEATSVRVARELKMMGFNKLFALEGGRMEWYLAHYQTEPKKYRVVFRTPLPPLQS